MAHFLLQNRERRSSHRLWKPYAYRRFLLLLSNDDALADLVRGIVKAHWKVVRQGTNGYLKREVFAQPNVRLVILDDQAIEEDNRGWLLAQIRKHFPGRCVANY